MSNIAIFRANQLPQYYPSVNTQEYENDAEVIINPDVTSVASIPLKYWKRVGNEIQEMTAEEKQTVDTALAAALLSSNRGVASVLQTATTGEGISWRALVLLLLDELNTLRTWTRDFKAQTALASSLADFKTRVATLSTLDDRTATQVKTAYSNKISAGNADA